MWMATVEKAVTQMVVGLIKKKSHIYITRRWVLVVRLLNITPNWLLRKFI
jgi:hypothetical protein